MALTAKVKTFAAASAMLAVSAGSAFAAECGNNAGGFEAWKAAFADQAAANGIKGNALSALAKTTYATKTIYADRNQKSFKLSLDQFMQKRGGKAIMPRQERSRSRTRRCSRASRRATACPPARCSRSGAWRPASAASWATNTRCRRRHARL
jgi:membrane-bound lytic murein transglycosylase B